jgi:hypothetical protein
MRKKEIENVITKRLIPIAPFLAVLAIVLAMAASDTAYASFTPELAVEIENPAPETLSNYTLEFGLPEGDVNFGGVVGFLPPEWGIVDGRDIPVGAEVGMLRADATLGLINSPCNQILPVEFTMLNASLDQGDTIDFDTEDGGGDPTTEDWAEDLDDNGLIQAIDQWPDFIFRTLEDTTEEPIRRSAGMAIVASTPVLLQFLIFPPGTFIDENIPNDVELGFPSVTLLQNAGDPEIEPEPGAITDFCTSLKSTNQSYGVTLDNPDTADDESGYPLFVNPLNGTYNFTVASVGLRDADGDTFENSLDTCPLVPNVGNPRIPNEGDNDSDGLDAACDPNDDPSSGGTNSDQDGDGYLNRQDNCPLIANGEDTTNQVDDDEDQIGDDCDPNPDSADTEGDLSLDSVDFDLVMGDGTGEGGAPDCPAVFEASTELRSDLPDDLTCVSAGQEPPDATDGPNGNGDDDGGSNTGLIIGIIVGVIAAAVVVGGGAMLMMRRGGGA